MEGVLKYLMQNYHVLGILVIVTIIAIKIFMASRQARKVMERVQEGPKLDELVTQLDRIERLLKEQGGSGGNRQQTKGASGKNTAAKGDPVETGERPTPTGSRNRRKRGPRTKTPSSSE